MCTVSPSAEVAITPCSTDTDSNTFACGLAGDCSRDTFTLPADTSIALRPSQIAALVSSLSAAPSAPTTTVCPDTSGLVSTGALAGVAVGVAFPLLLALLVTILLLRREKYRFSKPKLMYKLPDECKEEFTFRAPPPIHTTTSRDSRTTRDTASAYSSRRGSFRTAAGSPRPPLQGTFMERYEGMKKTVGGQTHELPSRHELDSTPSYREAVRHEMGDYRRSGSSQTLGVER